MASSLRMLGALDRVEEYARMAIAAEPDFAWPFLELTLLRLLQQRVDDAYKLATQAAQLQAEDAYSLTLLGRCKFALDRNEETRILASLAIETEPDNTSGYELLAQVARDEGDLPNTVGGLQQALQISPDDPLRVQRIADAQSALRQNVEWVDLHQASLASNPHDQHMQRSLKDSLMRVALFGDAGERRTSAAAVLTHGVFVYLFAWVLLYRWVAPLG